MRTWFAVVAMLSLLLSTTGCTTPTVTITITVSFPGSPTVKTNKTAAQISPNDVDDSANIPTNALIDVDPSLTYSASSPTQALVTVTTDTGQTFAQTFTLIQTDASSFAPAAPGDNTYAFTAQNPAAVSAFLRSAASNANATLSVAVQTQATFNGPSDGSEHTIYSRQYTSTSGVSNLGSVSYVAPTGHLLPPSDSNSIN